MHFPCPRRARSDGDQRSITVAHGHATHALTCAGPGQVGLADELLSSGSLTTLLVRTRDGSNQNPAAPAGRRDGQHNRAQTSCHPPRLEAWKITVKDTPTMRVTRDGTNTPRANLPQPSQRAHPEEGQCQPSRLHDITAQKVSAPTAIAASKGVGPSLWESPAS